MSDAQTLMRLNREAQAKLAEREATLDEREARLRADLDKVVAQKTEVSRERDALASAEQVYRRLFDLPDKEDSMLSSIGGKAPGLSGQSDGHDGVKPRARLGTQRYLMFATLSEAGRSLIALADATRLNPKRVKDQMVSDMRLGMVTGNDNHYRLTLAGKDLFDRTQAYKKAHNLPLPSLDDPPTEDDQDDPETENMMEGAMQG